LAFAQLLRVTSLGLALTAVTIGRVAAADEATDEVVSEIVKLLGDNDKDLRAVGLEQVRDQAKGRAATQRFAAALPTLPPEAQVGLLDALADRGDRTARPAVIGMLKSKVAQVRVAAFRALGLLGQAGDVPLLARALAGPAGPEETAAAAALVQLADPRTNRAIIAEFRKAKASVRAELLGILAKRGATDSIPAMLAAAGEHDDRVRAAALDALGQLARPDYLPSLVALELEATTGRQREAVERVISQTCGRIADPARRADPLLPIYAALGEQDKLTLLPTLGRLGGPAVLKIVETAIADADPRQRDAGLRALCNWPDGSVAARLLGLSKTAAEPGQRRMALAAVIRVAPLPDRRPPAEKLRMLKSAMELATCDEDRKLILNRASAIRTMSTLDYVASYLDNPRLAQQACATIVELAHHRELREPHKAQFDRLLDRVIGVSQDAVVVERAKRYKLGQTYKKTGGK
jgi:HEAT repeat protein